MYDVSAPELEVYCQVVVIYKVFVHLMQVCSNKAQNSDTNPITEAWLARKYHLFKKVINYFH